MLVEIEDIKVTVAGVTAALALVGASVKWLPGFLQSLSDWSKSRNPPTVDQSVDAAVSYMVDRNNSIDEWISRAHKAESEKEFLEERLLKKELECDFANLAAHDLLDTMEELIDLDNKEEKKALIRESLVRYMRKAPRSAQELDESALARAMRGAVGSEVLDEDTHRGKQSDRSESHQDGS